MASTLPAGGAVAVGVSWAMLSTWGLIRLLTAIPITALTAPGHG